MRLSRPTVPLVIHVGAPCPTVYDVQHDLRRPITQDEVDRLLGRAASLVSLRLAIDRTLAFHA